MPLMAVHLTRSSDRPFVGRARELQAAERILLDADRTGVILIGGEAGLGKTRLVDEIVALAAPATQVLRAAAVPRSTPIPFELVGAGTAAAQPALEGFATSADRVRSEAEALRSIHDGPVVFVFEDVHWADAESLEVVDRLIVAGPLHATILITYRPNELHPRDHTSVFLQRIERRREVGQFRLEPLRLEEVGDYLAAAGRRIDEAAVGHVHTRTGGNPLLLSELVASTDVDTDLAAGLPWTLAEMLRPEIDRLPDGERTVAEAVAVLGAEVSFDLLAAAAEATEEELLARLRSLVGNGVLVESGPDRFSYRHDLVREAVADGLFTREHRRLHAAVHDALLAADSDDVVALVEHALGAGRTKQAADAARDAALVAMADSRTHQALAFAEQALLEHTDDVRLLRVAVVAGWMVGQDHLALHHLDRWAEIVGSDDASFAEVLHHRVRLLWEVGDVTGADRAAESLAELAERLPEVPARAQALADVAQHHMLRGRESEAIEAADRAIEIAESIGEEAQGANRQARAERASARLTHEPDRAPVIAELLEIAREAQLAGDHVVASRALHNVPIQHPSVDAAAHVEAMRRSGERAGMSCMATESHRHRLLVVAQLEGDKEAFESQLDAARDDMADSQKVLIFSTHAAIDDRDFSSARQFAQALPADLETGHYSASWRFGLEGLVELLDTGDARPLREWFESLPADRLAEQFAVELALRYLSDLLDADLQPTLTTFFERDIVDGSFEPAYLGVRAELAGDVDHADGLYAQALREGMNRTVEEQAQLHLARARIADALDRDGAAHVDAARLRLNCWPGRQWDTVAAMTGVADSPEVPTALTPREREVAVLVANGLTNGGIADALFISTKTASVHVSNILSKLHMQSRVEIATWVTEGGLGDRG